MALGLGGYVAAVFHLFTHAFFKALLFLGAGSVNHATNSFDMRRMGGLRTPMQITFATFLVGALSLSGVFPLAGFWSKDEILLDALNHNRLLFGVGVLVAGMTAFYMFRTIFVVFFGQYRGGEPPEPGHDGAATPHESPPSMWVPLAMLAAPAAVIGWVNLGGGFSDLVEGALPPQLRHGAPDVDAVVLVASTAFALGGIGLAAAIYLYRQPSAEVLRARIAPLHRLVERKYFMDDIAETVMVRWVMDAGIGRLLALFDEIRGGRRSERRGPRHAAGRRRAAARRGGAAPGVHVAAAAGGDRRSRGDLRAQRQRAGTVGGAGADAVPGASARRRRGAGDHAPAE